MNEKHGMTANNLLASLPQVLRNDFRMKALAASVAGILSEHPAEIDDLYIYSSIDTMPEELLDILAYDFKVDWWDGDYSVEEKRRTLKESWRVHRMLGTKGAVKAAISAVYPETEVQEWFEYGGKPYHFKLRIDVTDEEIDSKRHRRVLDRINYYKNLRSHLEGVEYIIRAGGTATPRVGVAFAGSYTQVGVDVKVFGPLERPHANIPVRAGVRPAGIYTKMEVTVNGLE